MMHCAGRVVVVLHADSPLNASASLTNAASARVAFTVDDVVVSSTSVAQCECSTAQLLASEGTLQTASEGTTTLSSGASIAIALVAVLGGGGLLAMLWRRYHRQESERMVLATTGGCFGVGMCSDSVTARLAGVE